jgi:hypothetical protein
MKLFCQLRFPEQHLLRRSVHLYIPDGAMREILLIYSNAIKILISTLLIAFFVSCQSKEKVNAIDYSDFSKKKIVLAGIDKNYEQKDTLGILTIKVPNRLDTFYQWHNTSDCLPCGRMQYRFSDKHYQQFAESGMYWTFKPDSIYQFTITHNPIKEAPDSIRIKPFVIFDTNRFVGYLINDATWCEKTFFFQKKFKEINGRTFVISNFISSCSKITDTTSLFFTAQTTLRNRYLNVIAECSVRDSTGFIDNMYKSILSIRIEEK